MKLASIMSYLISYLLYYGTTSLLYYENNKICEIDKVNLLKNFNKILKRNFYEVILIKNIKEEPNVENKNEVSDFIIQTLFIKNNLIQVYSYDIGNEVNIDAKTIELHITASETLKENNSTKTNKKYKNYEECSLILASNLEDIIFISQNSKLFDSKNNIIFLLTKPTTEESIPQITFLNYFRKNFGIDPLCFFICQKSLQRYKLGLNSPQAGEDLISLQDHEVGSLWTNKSVGNLKEGFIKSLDGMELPVSLFIRIPTVVKPIPRSLKDDPIYQVLDNSYGYGGLDGMVLANLASVLNFTPNIKIPPPEAEYGYKVPNGTSFGSLGDVVYKKVIISFNGRFINDYGTDKIEFTTPVENDMLCIIVPSAKKVPQWLKIFRCFSLESWISIFGVYWATTFFWYNLRPINFKEIWRSSKKNSVAALEIYAFFVSAGVKLPSLGSHRIFFASCMFLNIVITGIFQGSLFRSYTTTSYYPNINTLQKFDDSGLRIGIASQSLAETFVNDTSMGRNLRNKVVINSGTSSMDRAAYQRDFAALERSADAKMRIRAEFTKPDGFELLHVVKECPRSYHVAYIVSKGSPFLSTFNRIITIFKESGLLSKWNQDTTNAFVRESRQKQKSESQKTKVFTLYDMQTAFYLLGVGLILSCVVFFVEILTKC